jgi:excisionase family DNA binding protein
MREPIPIEPQWVGPAGLPALTGGQLSRSKGYELMASGVLPYTQLGGKRLIAVTDVKAFLARLARSDAAHLTRTGS